jgi:hypothetical protein
MAHDNYIWNMCDIYHKCDTQYMCHTALLLTLTPSNTQKHFFWNNLEIFYDNLGIKQMWHTMTLCDTLTPLWHCDISVTLQFFLFIWNSNDGHRRHGMGTYLFFLKKEFKHFLQLPGMTNPSALSASLISLTLPSIFSSVSSKYFAARSRYLGSRSDSSA